MRRFLLPTAAGVVAVGLAIVAFATGPRTETSVDAPRLDITQALGGAPAEGFRRAERPRTFDFPRDHGPHDGYRTEWWYLTGTLASGSGERFGYQLTLFRQALAPEAPAGGSAWRTNHVWMAHLAVTDVEGRRFVARERFAREALGLAGAAAEPFRVHVGPWEIASQGAVDAPLRVSADAEDVAVELHLEPLVRPVPRGDGGLSAKGPEPGNASFYYSVPRLATRGHLRFGERTVAVEGVSWLDREWSTSALGEGVVGWDWFALRLDDGTDLMLYRLRRADGSATSESAAEWSGPGGDGASTAWSEIDLETTGRWTSPRGGEYPAAWRLRLPELDLDVTIEPLLADQELDLSVRYWEGAVGVRGTRGGKAVAGEGYVELTGYAAP